MIRFKDFQRGVRTKDERAKDTKEAITIAQTNHNLIIDEILL